MEKGNKLNLFEEHLRKIKYNSAYKINESPKYRPLVDAGEEYDIAPINMTNEAGDQEDAPKPDGGEMPPAPSNDQPMGMEEPPVPEFDAASAGNKPPMGGTPPPADGMPPVEAQAPPVEQVDQIQNEIIKHNIEAMKSIHDQLENLSNITQSLDNKFQTLTADVEEVREPTNSEKLMSKVNVSYPYYFNLNDYWSGTWFNEKRDQELSKGIKEMPDGTYTADFDELPQQSKTDIQNSFNDI